MTYSTALTLLLGLLPLALSAQTDSVALVARADTYRQQAERLYDAEKYDLATDYYHKAYTLVKAIDPVRAASLCVDLSSMAYRKSLFRPAADRCRSGLAHLQHVRQPPDTVLVKLYSSLGSIYKNLYQKDSALYYYRQADLLLSRRPAIEQQIPEYVLYHYNNQGKWFFQQGEYQKSLTYLNKALVVNRLHPAPEEASYIESNLAECYDVMGDYTNALISRRLALAHYPKNDLQQCNTLSGIAWTLYKLHRPAEALPYFGQANRLLATLRQQEQAVAYAPNAVHLWRMISTCLRDMKRLPEAEQFADKALRLHRLRIGSRGKLLAQVWIEKGEILEERQQLTQAQTCYTQAMQVLYSDSARAMYRPHTNTILDEGMLLLAAWQQARLTKKQFDNTGQATFRQQAMAAYQFCIALKQRMRRGIDTELSQQYASQQHYTLIPEAVAVMVDGRNGKLNPSEKETLFTLFEQAQAGSMQQALHLNAIKPRTIPAALLAEEQRLKQQMHEVAHKPVNAQTSTQLNALNLAWYRLLETFRQNYPAYYALSYSTPTLKLRDVQQQLGPESAYIAYIQHQTSLYILVVTASDSQIIRWQIDPLTFRQQTDMLRNQLYQDPMLGRYEGTPGAVYLYRTCLEPIRRWWATKKRLIIARDWSFAFLPFEALETGRTTNDYLTKHHTITYAFSANLFFNRPPVTPTQTRVLVVAPFTLTARSTNTQQTSTQLLLANEGEARQIGGELLLGTNATKQHFLSTDLARPMIFLATHAETNDTDPSASYVAFYPYGNAAGIDSGSLHSRLYTDEIYDLPLRSTRLVVLGMCRAGMGKTIRGEGILSLARAFSYAGCRSVVTTLWEANNEVTTFLSIHLHQYLADGLPIDEALQRARNDFFASSLFRKYNHPYYWANFVLVGNYDPVMEASAWPRWVGIIAGIILVLSILGWYRKHIWNFYLQWRHK